MALKALEELNIKEHLTMAEDMLLFLSILIFCQSFQRIDMNAYYYINECQESATRSIVSLKTINRWFADLSIILSNLKRILHK
ncbi:MAG: hypothetical protein ACRCV0_02680 [Brevinema sp.]